MPTFQDREQAFEAKWVHDEDLRFRVIARRDKLFAHQAAERLKLPEQGEAALVTAVLALRDGPDHDALLMRYMTDVFAEHGRDEASDGLSAMLETCDAKARQQLLAQPGRG